jgi:transcriptional regulator with XRE-family HTH domain
VTSEFGPLLRGLRRDARLTQEALAERAEVGVRTIRGLETGERSDPRIDTVRRLADALGLSPGERDELLAAAVGQPNQSDQLHEPVGPPAAPALPDPLADVAEQLASAVAARWQREEEQRQIQDPYPLPVHWTSAAEELTDHWANIRRLSPGDRAGPLELAGQLAEIVPVYRRIASGRLVVLGRSGSGKTVLALRFVLDRLKSRQHTEAVPVIFSIGSWHPTTITLRDWLIGQLVRDYPGLAAVAPGGSGLAAALVEAGLVLPVLDGFDEIADGLRRPALEALNATALPLLLTSRPAEYAAAVAETDVLTAAACIELTDLTITELADYLPRTTRKALGGDPAATVWEPVLAHLRDQPDNPVSANLRAVLTTPLMVTLARTIYSDTPEHDPATLLDATRFRGVDELEDHLLDNFIPTVYRRGATRESPFDPSRAQHWLGYLAHHLTRLGTPDLAWWRLGDGLRRPTRSLVTALMIGLAIGLVDFVVAAAFNSFAFNLLDVVAVGAPSGVMFGLAHWITVAARNRAVTPSAVRVRIRGRAGRPQLRTAHRLMIGLLCGSAFGGCYGLAVGAMNALVWRTGFSVALSIALVDALVLGLVFGLSAALGFGLVGLLEAPLDIGSAVNPTTLLHTNRRTVGTQLLLWAPTFGLLVGFGAGAAVSLLRGLLGTQAWSAADSVGMGVTGGISGALGYLLALTAWGQWAVFSRIWLPLTGKLPWSVVAFLEDAYRRGVLRQAGAVYQFRHARLQHHLTRAYRAAEREP